MQNKFKNVKGLTHGAYQCRYQQKENPIYYKLSYTKGICHGIFKFTYGEKEKPIYVERPIKQYTYWGREIRVEESEIKVPFTVKRIQIPHTIRLIKDAIRHLEQNGQCELKREQANNKVSYELPQLFSSRKDAAINLSSPFVQMNYLKKQLVLFENAYIQETEKKELTIQDIDKFLGLLTEVQVEVSKIISLSQSRHIEGVTEEYRVFDKVTQYIEHLSERLIVGSGTLDVDIVQDRILSRELLSNLQIEAIADLERDYHKQLEAFIDTMKYLERSDTFELLYQEFRNVLKRKTDLRLLEEGLNYLGTKSKEDNEIELSCIKQVVNKYLKVALEQTKMYQKQSISCSSESDTLTERNITKDMLSEIHKYLKRVVLKDMLLQEYIHILSKGIIRDITNNYLEQFIEKLTYKEILQVVQEQFFEKSIIQELSRLIHTKILVLVKDKEMIQNKVAKQLRKLQDRVRFLEVDNHEQLIEDITKYPVLIETLSQTIEETFKDIQVDEVEETIEYLLKSIIIEKEQNRLSETLKAVQQEEQYLLSKELLIQLKESEKTLKLYKRFWTIGNSDFKDLMILPDHDYPYESEPIIEDIKIMPENHHVVYPNEFYKCIDRHPIPNGEELAPNEIGVSIDVLIDLINIFMMMWCKFTTAFWGWTGTQAVIGMIDSIYEFITLENSRELQLEKGVKEQYDRAYKWLRWEGEQMALYARHDPELRGNYYVGLMLEELINYMIDHHFDVMPLFIDVHKMNEWRTLFNRQVDRDIKWVLDKVKGIRHKLLKE